MEEPTQSVDHTTGTDPRRNILAFACQGDVWPRVRREKASPAPNGRDLQSDAWSLKAAQLLRLAGRRAPARTTTTGSAVIGIGETKRDSTGQDGTRSSTSSIVM